MLLGSLTRPIHVVRIHEAKNPRSMNPRTFLPSEINPPLKFCLKRKNLPGSTPTNNFKVSASRIGRRDRHRFPLKVFKMMLSNADTVLVHLVGGRSMHALLVANLYGHKLALER